MLIDKSITSDEITSVLDWWREAGVGELVAETPLDWFAPRRPVRPRQADGDPPVEPAAAPAMLDSLEAFRAWLLEWEAIAAPRAERLDASGDPAASLMILVDQPEPEDARAGRLLSGDTGLLLDRMLAAIGLDRPSIYLAGLAPARAPGGQLDDVLVATLAPAAMHHVALVGPKRLLLMGDAPVRAFCRANVQAARGRSHKISHGAGTVEALATYHPRFLLQHPSAKAESWKDLRMLIGELNA